MRLTSLLFEVIEEPSRQTPKSISQLGVAANPDKDSAVGVKNIMAVYNDVTPEERDYWGRWYHHAKADVQELADEFQLPYEKVAAITAVLSPGNKWKLNLLASRRILEKAAKINSYPKNIEKANAILDEPDVSKCKSYILGPKVNAFFSSLMDPDAFMSEMVLDSHAINIWLGDKLSIQDTPTIKGQLRSKMVADYNAAAKQLGVSVQSLQAVTWYIWKFSSNNLPAAPLSSNFGMRLNLLKGLNK